MSRRIEPLPDDIVALLARSGEVTEPPTAVRERLRERLRPLFVAPPSGGSHGWRSTATKVAHGTASAVSKKATLALIGLGLGGGAGATLWIRGVAQRDHPRPGIAAPVPRPRPAAVPPARPPVPSASPATASPRSPERRRAHPVAPVVAPTAGGQLEGRDVQLAAEQTLLEAGQVALGRGDAAAALAAVEAHAREFPDGRLAEEREALGVRALLAGGHRAAALDAGRRFAARFPHSLLWPALARQLESSP